MFEGKPPELKRAELAKRSTKKEEATTELEAAKEVGGWVDRWADGWMGGCGSGWIPAEQT